MDKNNYNQKYFFHCITNYFLKLTTAATTKRLWVLGFVYLKVKFLSFSSSVNNIYSFMEFILSLLLPILLQRKKKIKSLIAS